MKWIICTIATVTMLFGINLPYNYDPFKAYVLAPPKTSDAIQAKPQRVSLPIVSAVLDKRVFVNGKWYEIGDTLGQYKLYHVGSRSVTFKYQNKIIALPIGDGSRIVQVKEKE